MPSNDAGRKRLITHVRDGAALSLTADSRRPKPQSGKRGVPEEYTKRGDFGCSSGAPHGWKQVAAQCM